MSARTFLRPAPLLGTAVAAWLLAAGLAAPAAALETRHFSKSFPADQAVRLANLAGEVELVAGSGDAVTVEATVHAEADGSAETRRLLEGMRWVASPDVLGKAGWALTYPVDDYRGFAYPGSGDSSPGWLSWLIDRDHTEVRWEGERVRIYGRPSSSVPILYVDLRITVPAGADLTLRNAVGAVDGGDLSGRLTVDTGSGGVRLGRFSGHLSVDTGSGAVEIARLEGDASLDTGSGDVEVGRVEASRLDIDTGSGDIEIGGGRVESSRLDTGSGSIRLLAVEVVEVVADTGSGDVEIQSSLAEARRIVADTGSGDVILHGGPDASFTLETDLGSGNLVVRYDDAELLRDDGELVGARRGDGRTRISVDTGSGDCVIGPGR